MRGGGVAVRIAGVVCQMRVTSRDFEGFGVFKPTSHSQAKLVRAASMSERRKYLALFPRVLLVVTSRTSHATSAVPSNAPDGRFSVDGGSTCGWRRTSTCSTRSSRGSTGVSFGSTRSIRALNFHQFCDGRTPWLGEVDLRGVALMEKDLAPRGDSIASAPPELVNGVQSIAMERHLAINWLCGAGEVYSETDTST